MIQRPQTIYLVIAVLLNLAVFFNPIYTKSMDDPAAWIGLTLAISLTLVMIIAVSAIFLYKNRPLQLKTVKFATYIQIVSLGAGAGVLFSVGRIGSHLVMEAIGCALIAATLLFLWLAGRGIKKDEELVKSMDRIR